MSGKHMHRKFPVRDPETGRMKEVTGNEALAEFKEAWCKECDVFQFLQPGINPSDVKPLCTVELLDTCPTYKKIQAFKAILADQADERAGLTKLKTSETLPASRTGMYLLKQIPISIIAANYVTAEGEIIEEVPAFTLNGRALAARYVTHPFIQIEYLYKGEI